MQVLISELVNVPHCWIEPSSVPAAISPMLAPSRRLEQELQGGHVTDLLLTSRGFSSHRDPPKLSWVYYYKWLINGVITVGSPMASEPSTADSVINWGNDFSGMTSLTIEVTYSSIQPVDS